MYECICCEGELLCLMRTRHSELQMGPKKCSATCGTYSHATRERGNPEERPKIGNEAAETALKQSCWYSIVAISVTSLVFKFKICLI